MSAVVWGKDDIANILLSNVQATANAMAATGTLNRAYVVGFRAAISCIALSFGITPALVLPDELQGEESQRRMLGG